jgi:hypothetical protein
MRTTKAASGSNFGMGLLLVGTARVLQQGTVGRGAARLNSPNFEVVGQDFGRKTSRLESDPQVLAL